MGTSLDRESMDRAIKLTQALLIKQGLLKQAAPENLDVIVGLVKGFHDELEELKAGHQKPPVDPPKDPPGRVEGTF